MRRTSVVLIFVTFALLPFAKSLSLEDNKLIVKINKELTPVLENIGKKNRLEYGHSCSYSNEENRTEVLIRLVEQIRSLTPHTDTEQYLLSIQSVVVEMGDLSGDYCNSEKTLECNSTGSCDCGDWNSRYQGIDLNFVWEKNTCVIPEGSRCETQEILNPTNGAPLADMLDLPFSSHHHKCSNQKSCISTRRRPGKECEGGLDCICQEGQNQGATATICTSALLIIVASFVVTFRVLNFNL